MEKSIKKGFIAVFTAIFAAILNDCYICNDLGGLKNYKDENYYKCVILINENDIKDGDIEKLIKELPKFNRVN